MDVELCTIKQKIYKNVKGTNCRYIHIAEADPNGKILLLYSRTIFLVNRMKHIHVSANLGLGDIQLNPSDKPRCR